MARRTRVALGLILAFTMGNLALYLLGTGFLYLVDNNNNNITSRIIGICYILVGAVIVSAIAFLLFFKTKKDKEEIELAKKEGSYRAGIAGLNRPSSYTMHIDAIGCGNAGPINIEDNRATCKAVCKDYDPKGKLGFKITDAHTFHEAMLRRSKELRKYNTLSLILLVVIFSWFFASPFLFKYMHVPKIVIAFILSLLGYLHVLLISCNKKYWENLGSSAYSDTVLKPAIASIMPNAFFKYDSYMKPNRLNGRQITRVGNNHEGGYHIFLQEGSNYFEYCNYHEWYYHRGGRNGTSTRREYFNGCIIATNFNTHKVKQHVRIVCSNPGPFNQETQGSWPHAAYGESLVDVESIQFNERYQVYAADPMDAYMLLTPYVIEKIGLIRQLYSNFTLWVGNGDIVLAIDKTKLLTIPTSISSDIINELNCETQLCKIRDVMRTLRNISASLNEKD